jgi:RNA polymerase sigma-70 factor (ECF subfamily)
LHEEELIAALASGNREAFRQLVSLYGDRVFNTSLGIVQHKEDAEDIAQEVFITVFRSIGKFRGESSLATWLYKVTVRHSLDYLKHKKRKKRGNPILRIFGQGKEEPLPDIPDFVHPGILLEKQEQARILFHAIEKLPDNQRIAFTLHKVEGLSYLEVSEAMETTLASVEALMHRAKQNLRKSLGNFYSRDP